jgi:hypothetical protein
LIQAQGEEEALVIVIATSVFNGQGIAPEPLYWVLFRVVLRDPERFEFLRKKQVAKSCRIVGKLSLSLASVAFFTTDVVDLVASVVVAMCVAGDMAVRVASASAITAATSSSVGAVR